MESVEAYMWKERRKSMTPPPTMSELRIILLGKNAEDVGRVGNFILDREASETGVPPVEQHSMSVGEVEGRHIILINFHHLFDTHLSEEELRECIAASSPGPHAFLLVTQKHNFTQEEGRRFKDILNSFSDQAHKYAVVVTYKRNMLRNMRWRKGAFYQFVEYFGGYHKLEHLNDTNPRKQLFEQIDKIVKSNGGTHLTCEIFVDAPEQAFPHEHQTTPHEERTNVPPEKKKPSLNLVENVTKHGILETMTKGHSVDTRNQPWTGHLAYRAMPKGPTHTFGLARDSSVSDSAERLNLVVCGSDAAVKASISDLLVGQRELRAESSSVCVKREAEVSGHLLNLVEMPALYNTHLSEEQVMQQTLHCVSLCPPGVHAFLFIVAVGPLYDKDKAEMEKLQRVFGSKVLDYMMVLFTAEQTESQSATNFIESIDEMKELVERCRNRYGVISTLGRSRDPQKILEYLKSVTSQEPYSLQMFVKVREETAVCEMEARHKEELRKKDLEIQKLKRKIQGEGDEEEKSGSGFLRVVLIGKTGNGKSATGNTILGRNEFKTQASTNSVTTVCQKAVGEIQGRPIAVVDTPGLFDTTLSNDHVQEEIVKCISMLAPGPHVFIIVLSVGRITKEELETMDLINKIFGMKAAMFSIVLFTRGDDLENQSIQEYIEESRIGQLKKLIRDCGDRCLVFNNKKKEDRTQVHELLKNIDMVIKSNAGKYFTNSMFQEAELAIKKKVEEILKAKEREIEAEKEKLEAKHKNEMEKLEKNLEEEKRKADLEKQQMEKTFKEKQEVLKNEFAQKEQEEKEKREMEDMKRSEEIQKQNAKIEELEKEKKHQQAKFEQKQKDRDEEDKRREERYREEKEKLKHEQNQAMEELKKRQQEERERRETEETRRRQVEEEERHSWERKIKEAEHERKEIQEDLKQKQREWKDEKKRQIKERDEADQDRKRRHDQELRATQEEQERMRREFEQEREKEQRQREEERQQWREKERKQEREYEEKKVQTRKEYEQLEKMRKEEWERRKREDDERRKEERRKLEELKEEIENELQEERKKREKEDRSRQEREEEMKKDFEKKMKDLQHKYEEDARKKAEEFNEFKDQKDKHLQELIEDHRKTYEILEELYRLTDGQKSDKIDKLREELNELKQKSRCVIL